MIEWIILLAPAIVIGSLLALLSAPLGCLVLWRQMAFFADTLAHSALLGLALAFVMGLPLWVGLLLVTVLIVLLLWFAHDDRLPNDALLGGVSASLLALGLVIISHTAELRTSMAGYLFGDLVTLTWQQAPFYITVSCVCIAVIALVWKAQMRVSINEDLAHISGVNVKLHKLLFMLILAGFVAVALQAVGTLLVSSLLVLPALSARLLSVSPKHMLVWAFGIGQFGIFAGMTTSVVFDIASGLAIVLTLGLLFITLFVAQKIFPVLSTNKL